MNYVYILRCFDGTYYVGLTEHLQARLEAHGNKTCRYTKSRLPVKLIWFAEFANKNKAAKFEQYLKSGSGNAFLKKRLV